MTNTDMQELERVIESVRSHETPFYRELWGAAEGLRVPSVSRDALRKTPLSRRRYKDERALVKLVRDPHGPFLSEWGFDDIGREPFGTILQRPMVYFADPYEAVEKAMWCYLRNRMPLIGENPHVACSSASQFEADSFILDAPSLAILEPYLRQLASPPPITIVGPSFDAPSLMPFARLGSVRLVLSLPETGVIAEAALAGIPRFTPAPGACLEYENGIVVSKARLLATPILRYQTEIRAAMEASGAFTLI